MKKWNIIQDEYQHINLDRNAIGQKLENFLEELGKKISSILKLKKPLQM